MPWNWELPQWPVFQFDSSKLEQMERQFLLSMGASMGFLKGLEDQEYQGFIIVILSSEGLESSKIEGEILDRESLQSSIKQHFGLKASSKREAEKEARMAKLLLDVYETFDQPLTHEMLWKWHFLLFDGHAQISGSGKYRSHPEPMQIVSNRYGVATGFFEAPPSEKVFDEMGLFIEWFNRSALSGSILGRAAIAHIYFECIHPFEDGNGRVGRMLVEKVLSQGVGQSVLIAVSRSLEKGKREYYTQLEKCNRTLRVQDWVEYFSEVILRAQEDSMNLLLFLVNKSKLLNSLIGRLNTRQEKVLLRMFAEGPSGFKGGLSAENYIAITGASRASATRDLSDLVEKKALLKTGKLRHTRYTLNLCGE